MEIRTPRPLGTSPDDLGWPDFEERRAHAFNKIRDTCPTDLAKGKFLDIGCGTGNGVIAASQNGFALSVGIDRDFREFLWFDINCFDDVCLHYNVDPAKTLMIEGDFFKCKFPRQSFDMVLLLDSIEHVPDPESFIREAARYVAVGGVLVVDTAPLYYSKSGHHLFGQFDSTICWAHLRYDFLQISRGFPEWSMERFDELNKVTHDHVANWTRDCGLEIVLEHRDASTQQDKELLDRHRPSLDLTGIDEKLLFEEWMLIVARRYI